MRHPDGCRHQHPSIMVMWLLFCLRPRPTQNLQERVLDFCELNSYYICCCICCCVRKVAPQHFIPPARITPFLLFWASFWQEIYTRHLRWFDSCMELCRTCVPLYSFLCLLHYLPSVVLFKTAMLSEKGHVAYRHPRLNRGACRLNDSCFVQRVSNDFVKTI